MFCLDVQGTRDVLGSWETFILLHFMIRYAIAKSAIGPHLKLSQNTARWNRRRVVFGMYDTICLEFHGAPGNACWTDTGTVLCCG